MESVIDARGGVIYATGSLDVQPRASSKVLDIVKCFCKSTIYITKRCRLRKQGCPCMVYARAPVHRFALTGIRSQFLRTQ